MNLLISIFGIGAFCSFVLAVMSLFKPQETLKFMPLIYRTRTTAFCFYAAAWLVCGFFIGYLGPMNKDSEEKEKYTVSLDRQAEYTIKNFIKTNAHDPDSYESVSFGFLERIAKDAYSIRHRYRARNGFGALMLYDEIYLLDTTCTKIISYMPANN